MKKIICGLMMVVTLMTIMANFAFAEETYDDVIHMIELWKSSNPEWDYYTEEGMNQYDYAYFIGALSKPYFEEETGVECNIENWIAFSKERYDITDLEVELVGYYGDREIYVCYVVAESDTIAYINGQDYTRGSALFMIYDGK